MLETDVLKSPAQFLSEEQRARYFEDGALVLDGAIGEPWLSRLREAAGEFVERSRTIAASDGAYILEDGHSAASPRLKRVSSPVDHHDAIRDFVFESPAGDVAADVVGPDVKYHHSKLNYKWARGGSRFDWHQDIQAWPHTDYSPVTVGVYLEDCGPDQGPLLAIRGSHRGPLHSMYDSQGRWVLRIPESEIDSTRSVALTGSAGSVVLLNCRTIHGSVPNRSDRSRPFLLTVYSSADSFPYTANPLPSPLSGRIVRGAPARWVSIDPRRCEVPPDWSAGYSGPWAHQARGAAGAAG